MPSLTQDQFDELSEIANSGQSGARVAYYTKLAEFGVTYGNLALGVVLEDQISGRVANAYFMTVAEQEGISVSPQQWAAIGNGLMLADLAARAASAITQPDGTTTYPDLGYVPIRNYHQQVFGNLGGTVPEGEGVSINGWTAYAPVETFGPETWDNMLVEAGLQQGTYGAWLYSKMWFHATFESDALADQWQSVIRSESFQQLLADGSPALFPDQIASSYLILGTHSGDHLSIDNAISPETQVLLMGLGGADTIAVNGHSDYFDGGAGDDAFLFTAMDGDFIHGGTGSDTADFSALAQSLQVQAEAGSTSVYSGYDWGSLRSIENVIGTSQNDGFAFYGSLAAQEIDSIDAGAGTDTIYLSDAVEQLHVDLEDGRVLGIREIAVINVENVVGGEAGDTLLGSSAANNIQGGSGDDQIEGRAGNDSLWGQAGNDILVGGIGADSLYAGDGDDTLRGDEGNDNLYADAGADHLSGGDGDDYLSGDDGDDHLWGENGKDRLYGGAGDDFLFGGEGNDTLTGGVGFNTVSGGLGEDWFYVYGSGNQTLITDFVLGIDHLTNGSGRTSYADTSEGLRLNYADGATAILAGLTTSTPDWTLYV
ncbi:calcium-binding protein (plasmid) [Agrobacterium leguminum]|uniref:calcium-binding protein n=1 Tax=Agrobacterium leguminum TaxID=2792015 RepID=UPI0010C9D4A4|nr:calcium-binding protein [Agrobacterium leguminum]WFS69519.1 calcium-binding protein [Agrobacterium leguminum]